MRINTDYHGMQLIDRRRIGDGAAPMGGAYTLPRFRGAAACVPAAMVVWVLATGPAPAALVDGLVVHNTFDGFEGATFPNGTIIENVAPGAVGGMGDVRVQYSTQPLGNVEGIAGNAGQFRAHGNLRLYYDDGLPHPGTDSFTLSYWVRLDQFDPNRFHSTVYTGAVGPSSGTGLRSYFRDTAQGAGRNLVAQVSGMDGGSYRRAGQSVLLPRAGHDVGNWHHVVVLVDREGEDGHQLRLYLDGSNAGAAAVHTVDGSTYNSGGSTSDQIPANTNITHSLNPPALGVNEGNTNALGGSMDEVGMWNRALAPMEISTITAAAMHYGRNVQEAQDGALGGTFAAAAAANDAYISSNAANTTFNLMGGAPGRDPAGGAIHGGGLLVGDGNSTLLQFDLSEMETLKTTQWEPGEYAQVVPGSAKLRLYQTDATIVATDLAGFELLSAWSESDVTFDNTPGTGSVSLFDQESLVQDFNTFSGSNFDALVQGWLDDPSTNFGLMLTADGGDNAFFSRSQVYGPLLEFEYQVVPEPSSAVMLLGLLLVVAGARRRGRSNRAGGHGAL